jgi:transcriptional regulator with XRE-family HTH domain
MAKIPVGASSLGEAVRLLREEKKMTLRALAEKTGLTAPFLSDLEHNRRSTNKLAELAAALEVPFEELQNLDSRLPPDLKEWLSANPDLVSVLKELKKSGRPVPLELLRTHTSRSK